jgi:hypothetical protein
MFVLTDVREYCVLCELPNRMNNELDGTRKEATVVVATVHTGKTAVNALGVLC